jgi:hypothetical protein
MEPGVSTERHTLCAQNTTATICDVNAQQAGTKPCVPRPLEINDEGMSGMRGVGGREHMLSNYRVFHSLLAPKFFL